MRTRPVTRFLLLGLTLGLVVATAVFCLYLTADGRSDAYYLRFTSPRQQSLILGTSRAAQGIQPAVINDMLGRDDVYNFSFTVGTSPYGEAYGELIQRKLAPPDGRPDLFILAVDPWSLSVSCASGPDTLCLEERDRFTGQLRRVASRPNLEYLYHYYDDPLYRIAWPASYSMEVQADGWLRVDLPMTQEAREANRIAKVEVYRRHARNWRLSPHRIRGLLELISSLRERGEVYLVRLPVDRLMMDIENDYAPGFADSLRSWSAKTATPLLDLTPNNPSYETLDGHHLEQASGRRASRAIAEFILRNRDPGRLLQ